MGKLDLSGLVKIIKTKGGHYIKKANSPLFQQLNYGAILGDEEDKSFTTNTGTTSGGLLGNLKTSAPQPYTGQATTADFDDWKVVPYAPTTVPPYNNPWTKPDPWNLPDPLKQADLAQQKIQRAWEEYDKEKLRRQQVIDDWKKLGMIDPADDSLDKKVNGFADAIYRDKIESIDIEATEELHEWCRKALEELKKEPKEITND